MPAICQGPACHGRSMTTWIHMDHYVTLPMPARENERTELTVSSPSYPTSHPLSYSPMLHASLNRTPARCASTCKTLTPPRPQSLLWPSLHSPVVIDDRAAAINVQRKSTLIARQVPRRRAILSLQRPGEACSDLLIYTGCGLSCASSAVLRWLLPGRLNRALLTLSHALDRVVRS